MVCVKCSFLENTDYDVIIPNKSHVEDIPLCHPKIPVKFSHLVAEGGQNTHPGNKNLTYWDKLVIEVNFVSTIKWERDKIFVSAPKESFQGIQLLSLKYMILNDYAWSWFMDFHATNEYAKNKWLK